MFTVDLHLKKETISTALYNLKEQIKLARATKEKIICFIVGYGSTGGSHKIRNAVLEQLKELKDKNQIKDYILGSNIDIFNEKFQNLKGKELLDEDYKKRKNPGEVIVIL